MPRRSSRRAARLERAAVGAALALACAFALSCEDDPTPPGDTTPPADVTDLSAGEATPFSVTLWWTAPGDDGNTGRAARYEVRSLNGTITNENWASAAVVPGVIEAPRVAGEAETLLVASLAPGQNYYFAVRAVDEASNWANVSNPATLTTLDAVAPDPVTNLATGTVTDSSVTLTWTAPGDDEDAGRATEYALRWSTTAPITSGNWNGATPVVGVPAPQSAGFPEEFVVQGLEPETQYWFALRTADEVPNISTLSNVATATTESAAARSEAELIQKLASAYQQRSVPDFNNLFPTDDQADFLFILNEPDPDDGSTSWGRTVELSVHQRMFRPEETPSGDPPVPPELWLNEILITLAPMGQFQERTDLYQPGGPLDPARWRATDAEYHANLFFGTQGETDYAVDGRANFVVINDLAKAVGEHRKFLIYRWEDLGSFFATAVEQESWTGIKSLYK